MKSVDHKEYSKIFKEISSAYVKDSDFKGAFDKFYNAKLLLNEYNQTVYSRLSDQNGGAVLRVLMNNNSFLVPLYRDPFTLFRRAAMQNGTNITLHGYHFDEDMSVADKFFAIQGKLTLFMEKEKEKAALIYCPTLREALLSDSFADLVYNKGLASLVEKYKQEKMIEQDTLDLKVREKAAAHTIETVEFVSRKPDVRPSTRRQEIELPRHYVTIRHKSASDKQ